MTKGRLLTVAPLLLLTSHLSPLTSHLLLLRCDQLCQTALLPRGGILVDDVFLRGSVKELDRLGVRGRSLRSRCRTNLSQCSSQGAAVGAVLNGPGTALTHTFCGGSDTGHGYLRSWKVCSGTLRELSRKT
jgi:hypothetical protein